MNANEIAEVVRTIDAMHADHVKYPQLRLPEMQADRLKRLMKLVHTDLMNDRQADFQQDLHGRRRRL